jgi:hypothetical protein
VSFEPFENNKVKVGTITDIEDDLGRLHVKVMNRAAHKSSVSAFPLQLHVRNKMTHFNPLFRELEESRTRGCR